MCRLLAIPFIFGASSLFLWLLIRSAPTLNSHRRATRDTQNHVDVDAHNNYDTISYYAYTFSIPQQYYNATQIALDLREYKEDHYSYVLTLYVVAYLYKQSFAIPGSFFLNVIGGAVFGLWVGLILSCILTTVGATICYMLSEAFGKQYVLYYFGSRVSYIQKKVEQNTRSLFLFLLFARLFPISPSWFLNIIAPYLEIPLPLFIVTVFIGLAPYNFLCVQAGSILSEIHSWHDIFDIYTIIQLSSLALVPLLLSIFIKPKAQEVNSSSNGTPPLPSKMVNQIV